MRKNLLLAVTLLGVCFAGWVSSRGVGKAEAAGQQETPQSPPTIPSYGNGQQGDGKTLPSIPQEYFPPVVVPANSGQRPQQKTIDLQTPSYSPANGGSSSSFPPMTGGQAIQPKSMDLPTPSRVARPTSRFGSEPPQATGNAPMAQGVGDTKLAPFATGGAFNRSQAIEAPPPGRTAAPDINATPRGAAPELVGGEEQGQSNDNPTGRQEPSVSLEWIGPPTAKLGQPVTYQIIVKNTSAIPVQNVTVRNRIPAGVTVQQTEPRAINELNTLIWEVGTMQPRQEKRIDLQLLPEARGDLACQAFVSFTGMSQARIRVREPKLQLKIAGPDKVLLGDAAPFSLTVTNPGDGSADQVKIRAALSDGLEHTRGRTVEFELGNLGPNESRSVQLVCTTKTGGPQTCEAMAIAEGGLKAQDVATTEVLLPRLEINIAGPKLRYLDRKATYVVKVVNPGSAPASNVTINSLIPDGFKFLTASDGGRHDFATRTVSWYLGDLTPGQLREMSIELLAINPGEYHIAANVTAARGLKSETDVITHVEGLSALLMEMVDLDDPVEVGADTAYEIRVTNTGSKTETNLQLICTIPDKMEFRSAVGAGGARSHLQGKELTFEPIPKLAPRADVIYRVNVRGVAPGDLRFRARITADGLTEPVLKEESTKVYGDDVIK
jgi:uncharacterized repeat protein (TIGR01451 family)